MELQKINWKLFIKTPDTATPERFFKIFNAWIPDSPEVFIDVADYKHVHDGPLILLVGHYVDYALDATGRELGLLYNRKQPMEGSAAERVRQSLCDVLKAAARLADDAEFAGQLLFDTSRFGFIVNDRALAPNTAATFQAIAPLLTAVFEPIFGVGNVRLDHLQDPKQRFTVTVQTTNSASLAELVARLN